MAATRRLSELVDRVSSRTKFPDRNLVVALSGGADSGALAYLAQLTGQEVRLLHVDHGFTHSLEMKVAAEAIAAKLEAPLETVEVTVPPGPSIEGQARRVRYGAFAAAVPESEALLTGHTRNDQAETVVLNMLRGSGVRGIAGIPPFRPPNIFRPLLDVSRSETREIAVLLGLPFRDDPMNLHPLLRRNAVRLEVIPFLERFNAQLTDSFARLANAARFDSEHLDAEASGVAIQTKGDSVRVAAGAVQSAEPAIVSRILSRMLRSIRDSGPTVEELDRIRAVLMGDSSSEQITPGIVVRREGPMLVMSATSEVFDKTAQVELVAGSHRIGDVVLDVEKRADVCRVASIGVRSAIFPASTSLTAVLSGSGEIVVSADGEPAWIAGVKRHPVAFYQPGSTGYLSVFTTEGSDEWTSSL